MRTSKKKKSKSTQLPPFMVQVNTSDLALMKKNKSMDTYVLRPLPGLQRQVIVMATGSSYGLITEAQRGDLFPESFDYNHTLSYQTGVVKAPNESVDQQIYSIIRTEATTSPNQITINNDNNSNLMKLLEKWFNEPPIAGDDWWDKFSEDLEETRRTGWNW